MHHAHRSLSATILLSICAWASAREANSPSSAPARAIAPFNSTQARNYQESWAKHEHTAVEERNSAGMSLVLIPPGEFQMGSNDEQRAFALQWLKNMPRSAPGEDVRVRDEEGPQHRVVITRPFKIGRTEVTIGQYRLFVTATGYTTETERDAAEAARNPAVKPARKFTGTWTAPGYKVTDELPVSQITWADTILFCNWLSQQEGRDVCYRLNEQGMWVRIPGAQGYRLPTEAEWEYACRAGTTTHYSFGDDVRDLDDHAWFNRTAEIKGGPIGARPVGSKRPNPFGLYDMHGNVWERCQDFFDPQAHRKSRVEDPEGPPEGKNHIARGGGWHYFDLHARSAYRNNYQEYFRTGNTGFRVVRGL